MSIALATPPASPRPPRRAGGSGVVVAAATLVSVVLALTLWWRERDDASSRLDGLVEAAGDIRYVEGRLSGGFRHGPLRSPTRGPDHLSNRNLALLAAAGELQKAAEAGPTAENLHAWGVAQVLLGEHDAAVATLEDALQEAPGAFAVQSDLAAAYLARFSASNRPEDLPLALEYAERAIAVDPAREETYFTRALALEHLRLRDMAIAAWREYLERDNSSPWSADARARLAALLANEPVSRWEALQQGLQAVDASAAAIVAEFPEEAPDVLLGDLLPGWARAVQGGDARLAAAHLALGVELARQASGATGDPSLVDSMRRLEGTLPPAVVAGVAELGRGAALLAQDQYLAAEPAFTAARAALSDRFPTLAGWAAFNLARVKYFRSLTSEALTILDEVVAFASPRQQRQLEARAHWVGGLIHFTRGDYERSRAKYEEAIRLFRDGREPRGGATAHMNIAVIYRFLGDRHEGWRYRLAALDMMPRHRPRRYYGFLTTTAISAALDGMPRVALRAMDEAVVAAERLGTPTIVAEAYLQRARLQLRGGSLEAATADLTRASAELTRIDDDVARQRAEASLAVAGAEVYQRADPARAIILARQATAALRARDDHVRLAEVAVSEGRALAALQRPGEAMAALDSGIQDFERARASVPMDDPVRLSALVPAWELFDEMFALRVSPEDFDRPAALRALEASRARTLADSRQLLPVEWSDLRSRLNGNTAVVVLHQREEELLVWQIEGHGDRLVRLPIGRDAAARLVKRVRREVGRDEVSGAGARLRAQVLDALDLAPDGLLVIVPGGVFQSVPWSALPDSAGVPLMRKWAVLTAPSVSMAFRSVAGGRGHGALVVGAPQVAGEAALPAVAGEVERIAAMYPGARVLLGADATPEQVLGLAASPAVLHVAAHAIDNANYPLLSRILLSGEGGGELTAMQIVKRLSLPGSIVVLASCSSIGTAAIEGEGSIGLGWAFLRAGAGAVIGSVWELDDRASADLFVDVHRHLRAGASPAEALRRAQAAAMERGVPASVWAALQVFGHSGFDHKETT